MKPILMFFSSLLSFLVLASTAGAQTDWMRQSPEGSFSVEYLRPQFADNDYERISGSIALLTGRWNISEATKLVLEVSYVTTTREYVYNNYSYNPATGSYYSSFQTTRSTKSGLTSIGFGAEFGSTASSSSGEVMLHMPALAKKNSSAGYAGWVGDFPHFERYITQSLFLHGGYRYHPLLPGNIRAYLSLEPLFWFHSGFKAKVDVVLDYSGGVGYDNGSLKAGIGIGSRWAVTESWVVSPVPTQHHLMAEVSFRFGTLEPGISYLRQLDRSITSRVKNTLGFRMTLLF